MRSCAGLAVICLGLVAEVAAAEPVVHIRANQVGYLPGDSKIAVAFSNTPVTGTFALVEDGTAHVALTGDLAAAPASGWDGFAYYYRARLYAAQLGRFASRDPVGYVDGPILYAAYFAVRGLLDPTGLSCRIEWEADLEECNDQAIECNRRCMKKRPPWPLKKGSYAHVAYCEAKCQAAYMACTAVADAAYAACRVKENAKPVCVGDCGVVLVVAGAAICCVDTPAPGPADCVGAPIAACGMLMLCPPDEKEEPRDYP